MRTVAFAAAMAAVGAIGLAPSRVSAETYPVRPVRLIVPYPAGGPTDVMARLIAQRLSATLGQQMIVDNRPGAGSTLAGREAARAEPDGYTLLLGSAATLAIGPALYKNVGYDPLKSFIPVGMVSSVPYVLIAGPSVPVATTRDLIAYAAANPGKLNFGVPNGAPPHMLAAWFKQLTGTDMVIVPYKGAANVITDLMSGQVEVAFETTSVVLSHLGDGSLRALGVAAPARLAALPDTPTLIESGIRDFVGTSWTGIMAPSGTPPAIVKTLNAAINAGLASSELQARFSQLAADARPGTPEDFARFIAAEAPKWATMAKLSDIRPE
jgi:tripartite-type tricarboxylate transporter receptor subunit TctC